MDAKNQNPDASGPVCDCGDAPATQAPDCPPPDGKKYKALVLACIDPRMQEPVYKYLKKRKLTGEYSQVTIAGAAIGVVAPRFNAWRQTFWDNLNISIALHKVPKIIVINHRKCGAAKEAYGPFDDEEQLHSVVFANFRRELSKHHPLLKVETLLMDLKGHVKPLT